MEQNKKSILKEIVRKTNILKNIGQLEDDIEYIVDISPYKDEIRRGEMELMSNQSTGVIYPVLIKRLENGRPEIVCPLKVKERKLFKRHTNSSDLAFANYCQTLAIRQQTEAQLQKLDQIKAEINEIKETQNDERIGKIEAGKEQVRNAIHTENPDMAPGYFANGIQDLVEAKCGLEETIKRKAQSFDPLPKKEVKLVYKEFLNENYFRQKDKEIEEIQDCYDLYLKALRLIASSHYLNGDQKLAEMTYNDAISSFSTIDFSKIKTIENIHQNCDDMFFNHPVEYIEYDKGLISEQFRKTEIVITKKEIEEVAKEENEERISKALFRF